MVRFRNFDTGAEIACARLTLFVEAWAWQPQFPPRAIVRWYALACDSTGRTILEEPFVCFARTCSQVFWCDQRVDISTLTIELGPRLQALAEGRKVHLPKPGVHVCYLQKLSDPTAA